MANPSSQYVQAEAKGRVLFQRLEERLNDPNAHDRVQANVEINYELESWEGIADLGSAALEHASFNENIDIEGWTFVNVKSNGYQDPAYSNFLSAPQGSILCTNNDKLRDYIAPGSRLEWSDIIFQVYQMEAVKKYQALRGLRTIWRYHIINPDTRRILGEARTHGSPEDQGLPFIEYRPGRTTNDSGFFALLGCPNGSGIVRMLTDHCSALGNRTVESVRVLNSSAITSPPTMYFVLADVATTTLAKSSKRSAAGQRRHAKRQTKSDPGGSKRSRLLGSA
ncbi:MAG: hypothetical protein ALECFALPRED_010556 [Alectoria fallacina]|uniref:Uncharacterized protein n=1 Tax=Alectoria fallacina TaxID=1903189 RepID=A0A8H3PKW5_9LECA|nr:MAG: hypothetical protein ALECFALPRED_010556 [Alectoria fallacina]